MKTAARSALATVTSILVRAGFKAVVHTGRNRRPGFHTCDGRTVGVAGGVVLFDYTRDNGDFAKMCDALIAAGYALTDAEGGANFVARGCARVRLRATVAA
jgi:hypothetical protein